MKKSLVLKFILIIFLALILSACAGIRVDGTPGVAVSDELVIVSYGNFIWALDLTSGNIVWHYPEEENNKLFFYAPPLVTDGFVYVGDLAKNFHKLDIQTGAAEWTFSGGQGYYIGKAAEFEGVVYAPSNDGNLYALNAGGELLWSFETGHYIWTQPLITTSAIYVGSMDHHVYALTKNGDEIWNYPMGGAVVNALVLSPDESAVYAGSLGGEMVALDASTGDLLWNFQTEKSLWGKPIFLNGTLYFADSGSSGNSGNSFQSSVFALNPANGQMIWSAPVMFNGSVIGGLTAVEDGFALATKEGQLRVYNPDGTLRWDRQIVGEIFQAPVVTDEYLVVGTIDGEELLHNFTLTNTLKWAETPEK